MNNIHPYYFISAAAGIALLLFFPVTKHIRERSRRRDYWILQSITILGALLGAKISVLMGDQGWPFRPVEDWSALLTSGRSITGALIGGFLFAEVAKPLLNYKMPPNDRFAAVLPFSIALGRIGCALSGCCLCAPTDSPFSITYGDGIHRHPTQIYEMLFHLTVGITFMFMAQKKILFGRLFALYLVIYGIFRALTEEIRVTPKDWSGFSAYQWLSLIMIVLGGGFLIKRTYLQPQTWKLYEQRT